MAESVLDGLEDEENENKGEENEFEIVVGEDIENKPTPKQVANQKRVKREISEFILKGLGGVPNKYSRTDAKRLWGNRWRVNVITLDKKGDSKYTHSYFVHYQLDNITVDKQTPLVKLYSNYEEVFSTTVLLAEGEQS